MDELLDKMIRSDFGYAFHRPTVYVQILMREFGLTRKDAGQVYKEFMIKQYRLKE